MIIRAETAADIAAIHDITAAAFAPDPHSDGSEPQIIARLRNAGALTLSIVAELDGTVIAHCAFSPVTMPDGAEVWFGLGPVAVAPDHQNQGAGSAVIRHGLTQLQELGAAGCVALGSPAYYPRFGFKETRGRISKACPPSTSWPKAFVAMSPPAQLFIILHFMAKSEALSRRRHHHRHPHHRRRGAPIHHRAGAGLCLMTVACRQNPSSNTAHLRHGAGCPRGGGEVPLRAASIPRITRRSPR